MDGVLSVRRRRLVWTAIIVAVLLVGLLVGGHRAVRASGISQVCSDINSIDTNFETPWWSANVAFNHGERVVATAGDPSSGSPTSLQLLFNGSLIDSTSFPGTISHTFNGNEPLPIHWEVDTGTATFHFHCYPPEGPEPPYTGINLLSDAEQVPYLSVPNADGATPCGVFDVNGWGAKYVGMGDFPGCTAPVTVMCFTGDGAWTADTVSGVVMHGTWEVDFTSSQDGTCALFEQ